MIYFPFENQYVHLGDDFYHKTRPAIVSNPTLIQFNHELADELGIRLSDFNPQQAAEIFSGKIIPADAEPLAMAYAGHQFGHFNPQLGDGRAILLGEIRAKNGQLYGLQLKGSGQTAYSRNGDGRAALGPVLREYLLSEAMAKLSVPTTRALAAVTTGEPVARERLLPGGVITRVAASFIRVGSFQYFAARGDEAAIKKLADYVIANNYPQLADSANPYADFLQQLVLKQADLIARWMCLGFIHGVMNTDNMSVAGETIDYGPCAFMDGYSHDQVFSSIDRDGRYAYNNQPSIGLWNLTRLAECLIPLLDNDTDRAVSIATDILKTYGGHYEDHWLAGMRAKCGIFEAGDEQAGEDKQLLDEWLNIMDESQADFSLSFFYLSLLHLQADEQDNALIDLYENKTAIQQWLAKWRKRIAMQKLDDGQRQKQMQAVNPVYIPRNHQIEAVIRAAEDHGDFTPFYQLYEVLQKPFELQAGKAQYMQPPKPEEVVRQTFCGT